MRLATIVAGGDAMVGVVRGTRVLPLPTTGEGFRSMRAIAAGGAGTLDHIRNGTAGQPDDAGLRLDDVTIAPVVPDPGAIYTIGLNYRSPADADDVRPERPLVYGKAHNSVAADGAVLSWDRGTAPNVDAEVELGVVIGRPAWQVPIEDAMGHVFGYTIVNDVSSRDPWLDGDQWLLGKSMPGFCPVGPWIVTADEFAPDALRLGCTINGEPIQDGTTADMRFSVAEIVAFLSRHLALGPGDLIATGTPARLVSPPGPDRRLRAGDVVTAWIDRIGELTTTIA